MNKKVLGLIAGAFLVASTTLIATRASMKVSFAQAEWNQAQTVATQQKKLFFVDFDASYCAACRNMEQSTYMDNNLANYINQNVVALRVDVQDFDGVMWSQKYEVDALPTMLIFDEKGNLVDRLVGFQSAANLLTAFQKHRNIAAAPIAQTHTSNTNAAPAPMPKDEPLSNSTKPITSNTNTNNTTKPNTAPTLFGSGKLSTSAPSGAITNPAAQGMALFDIVVNRAYRKGFAVQVGAYSSYETALDQAELMRELYEQRTILAVDKSAADIAYRLLIAGFNTREEATQFLSVLRKNKMDGLVRDLSTL